MHFVFVTVVEKAAHAQEARDRLRKPSNKRLDIPRHSLDPPSLNQVHPTPVSQVEVVLKVAPLRSGCNCIDHHGKQTSSL